MGRYENTLIFEDTRHLYDTDPILKQAVADSLSTQHLVWEQDKLTSHAGEKKYDAPCQVVVSRKRSFEAAAGYLGKKVCVLNFASATNPGGGVVNGASAQEECLCRVSTLYPCLDSRPTWDHFYRPHRQDYDPLHNDDCVYTPGVVVFKSDTASPQLLPRDSWYGVDVLTCAAPDLRDKNFAPGDRTKPTDKQLAAIHEKRARRILDLAAEEGAEVVILGAFGCGAFRNPPEVVAAGIKAALVDYRGCFEAVEFAVYCRPGDDRNYRAFDMALRFHRNSRC